MKNRLFILMLLTIAISCKAQVIGTLEQFEECPMRPNHDEGCPAGGIKINLPDEPADIIFTKQ